MTGAGSSGGSSQATVALTHPGRLAGPLTLARPRTSPQQLVGLLALGALFAGTAAVVIFAAAGPTVLVANSGVSFPGWLSGPLHGLFGHLIRRTAVLNDGFSVLIVMMTLAYVVALSAARSLSMRAIAVFAVAAAVVLVLSPPLQLTDMFNYLGYARLGAVHHLNPYTHVIGAEAFDPVAHLATWRNWHSPYGTLFTAITYPIAWLPLPGAYWTLKVLTVLLSLVFLWLVYKCALLLGRDPRLPVLFVAANPVFLIYAVGEFHNDFFMLVPAMAAIAFVLSGRHRSAGIAMAAAIFVKYTVVLLLPFLLFAEWKKGGTRRLVSGLLIGGIPLAIMSVVLFGVAVPNVNGQSRLLTHLSIPNLLGWPLGLGGGAPGLVSAMQFVIVAVVGYELLRRREWLSGAGWATVALLASLGWLMPWYVVWLLPLAALASSTRLRTVAVATSLFVILCFLPVTDRFLTTHGIRTLNSRVGNAALTFQRNAQSWPWARGKL